MRLQLEFRLLTASSLLLALQSGTAFAAAPEGHGPSNPGFLSHRFQVAPHRYRPELNLHFGLSQPILLRGVNVAVDIRFDRWVFEYSHGMFLDYNAIPALARAHVGSSGADLGSPWTTGTGVGFILLDDLYLMVELKAHRYRVGLGADSRSYTTVSVGPAIAYRLFIYRGLNVTAYLRWWPTIWSSSGDEVKVGDSVFSPVNLGIFGNLSIGYAFDL